MARFITFQDTIKADSEREAFNTINRLYPFADDVELLSRENSSGDISPVGRFFVFQVTMEQEAEIDLAPEDLGEEEY